ncbi:MAG: carbohydrate-binding domain-containing protein [Tannerella sp.]|jgi:hypothetical protein|nr:carbohydrate-binding domain-containing protein [Tannerella sp.]
MKKKILQNLLLAIAIAMSGIGATQTASAQTTINMSTVSGAGTGYTYGPDPNASGINVVTLTTPGGSYEISGTTTTKTIAVQSGITANITLNSVSINVSGTSNACAFNMSDATVSLTLAGTNTLKSGWLRAGIYVPDNGADLTIGGSGILNATGHTSSAGIGGGYHVSCGAVTINGGTVTATGGTDAAGIGGGYNGTAGSLEINGGSVNRTGGDSSLESIALNSASAPVYLSTLTVGTPAFANDTITAGTISDGTFVNTIYPNVPDASSGEYGIHDVVTDAAGKVYFWLPVETLSGTNTRSITLTADNGLTYGNVGVPGLAGNNSAILKLPVTNSGGSATVTYTGSAIDLSAISSLFTLDANAGTPTYSIETGGTGTGSLSGTTLTVTNVGTFTIGLTTAETTSYQAGALVTATLTVVIAPTISGSVTSLPPASIADGPYSINVAAALGITGAPAPTVTVTGLPDGLTLSGGVITSAAHPRRPARIRLPLRYPMPAGLLPQP